MKEKKEKEIKEKDMREKKKVKRTVPKEKKAKPEAEGPKKLTRNEMVERDKRVYGSITRFFGGGAAKDSKAAVLKGAEEGGAEPKA